MKAELEGKIKYAVWGVIGGAVVAMFIGFSWGGWSTAGATQKISEQAVVENKAAICVAQYMAQPNSDVKLKEVATVEIYKLAGLIEEGGWDKMPGQKEASHTVSRLCAEGVLALVKK